MARAPGSRPDFQDVTVLMPGVLLPDRLLGPAVAALQARISLM